MYKRFKVLKNFVFKVGTYAFNVMPLRLLNTPATYQKAVDKSLYGLSFILVYLDDKLMLSKTIEEHLDHIAKVLDLTSKYNLKLNIAKCQFVQYKIRLLFQVDGN